MNIILIIVDTVRADYCGCYGNTWVRTPHIDALAREATLFEQFHSASFPTGPMRKDVFSGRFTFTYANWGAERPADEVTLVDVLNEHGYKTAFIGDTNNSPQYRQGFGYEEIVSSWAAGLDEIPEGVDLPADPRKLRIPMGRIDRIVRNAMAWDGEEERRSARTMRSAHKWLENQIGSDQQFFLWVDTFDPHEPWDCPHYYIDAYDPGYEGDELMEPAYERADYASKAEIDHMRCMYAGKLTMVDRWIGYLLDGVRQMGLWDDTAIIFTSDHGFYHGEHDLIGKVGLDRDGAICGRWPLYETLSHAPLLIKVPGEASNVIRQTYCQPPDLMPTILELAGAPIPEGVQGGSILPVVKEEQDLLREFAVSSLNYVQDAEVRSPTSYRTADWLYIYGGDEWDHELFDLNNDPGETTNVIDDNQEIAAQLHEDLLKFLRSVDCPTKSLDARREFRPVPRKDVPYRKLI